MKPLNLNTTGCDPISSNCVIWQGPDIPCINLCKGDTVSDVVYKLATELCTVLEALDVSTYDLPDDCFINQTCKPADFHDLIQIIINKLCCLESLPEAADCAGTGLTSNTSARLAGESTSTSGGCPDCVVSIAKCFYYTNEFGDMVTTMQLTDYVRTIGNKLCEIVNSVSVLTDAVNDLDLRVTALENAPEPTILLPQVTPTCTILPPAPTDMSLVLSVLEQQFCQLVSVTGNPVNLGQAIGAQCSALNTSQALGTSGGTMSTIPGWIISANTVAATLNNMWLTVCDLRSAVRNMQLTCCPSGCDGIDVTLTATLVGPNLTLYFSGAIPTGFTDCSPSGNTFKITDALGSSLSVNIDTVNYINASGGFVIDIGSSVLNPVLDMVISSDLCYTNSSTNTTCQFCITYNLTNTTGCPQLVLIPNITGDGVSVQFNPVSVPGTYTVEIWDNLFLSVVATQTQLLTSYGLTTYNFVGLNPSTVYNARLVISIGDNTRNCPYVPFTTNPILCLPASAATAIVNVPVLCDTCGPAIDFVSNPAGDGVYTDDLSQYLFTRSGGAFTNIYTDVYQASMPGLAPSSVTLRNSATTASGDTYISYNNSGGASPSILYHYDSTGTLVNTITFPNAGASYINCASIDASKFDGKIYFISWSSALLNPLSVYVLDPADDSYTKLVNISAALIGFPSVRVNPLNGHLMFPNNLGSIQIGNPSTDTMINTGANVIPESGFPVVNESNGYIWVARNGWNTINIWDVSGVTPVNVGTATGPAGYLARTGSANGGVFPITYYPGDGTPGTDRMFAVFNDPVAPVLPTLTVVIEFDATAPYTATTFVSLPYQFSPVNVSHSVSFNKIFLSYGNTIDAYSPTDGSVSFASITTAGTNLLWPYEDTTNKQIVYFNMAANPINNIYWIGLDTTNASLCAEGIVNMYLGNEGPYEFNTTTSSWDSMCTSVALASTPSPGLFTVQAAFNASVVSAALLYSINGGITWIPLIDNAGNLYANPGTWLSGRVYTYPAPSLSLKVTFTTSDSCGLEGSVMLLP